MWVTRLRWELGGWWSDKTIKLGLFLNLLKTNLAHPNAMEHFSKSFLSILSLFADGFTHEFLSGNWMI